MNLIALIIFIVEKKLRKNHEKTLLTTTALVAMAGAVTDEITVTGVVGFGLQTTEGTAAVAAGANGKATTQMVTVAAAANGGTAVGALANDTVATADDLIALDAAIAASEARDAADLDKATQDEENVKTGTLKAINAALTVTAVVAKTNDSTTAKNRAQIEFGLSGETDRGLEFGASIRATMPQAATAALVVRNI